MSVWYDNFVDCRDSDVHNSQLNIKSKGKNDTQSRMAQTKRKTLLPSNLKREE
jgi:hypothetical protein